MFVRGYENFGAQIEDQKIQGMKSKKKDRLFASKGKSITFVFLDDPGLGLPEHQLTFAGQNNYNNFFNCLKDKCPICYAGYRPNFVSLYTVFDLTPWTNKEGKRGSFTKKIYAAKESEIGCLVKFRQDFGGSLKGGVFTLTKGTAQRDRAVISPALRNGSIVKISDLELIQMVSNDGYKPELAQPYNYETLFSDDSVAMLEAQIPRILVQNKNNNSQVPPAYGQPQQYGQQPQQFAPQQPQQYQQPQYGHPQEPYGQTQAPQYGQTQAPQYGQSPQQFAPQQPLAAQPQQYGQPQQQQYTPQLPQGIPLYPEVKDQNLPDIPF